MLLYCGCRRRWLHLGVNGLPGRIHIAFQLPHVGDLFMLLSLLFFCFGFCCLFFLLHLKCFKTYRKSYKSLSKGLFSFPEPFDNDLLTRGPLISTAHKNHVVQPLTESLCMTATIITFLCQPQNTNVLLFPFHTRLHWLLNVGSFRISVLKYAKRCSAQAMCWKS